MYAAASAVTGRLLHYAASGVVGVLLVRGAAKASPNASPAARKLLITGIAGGIMTGRRLGAAAEEARLKAGDIVAEARASLGEEAPPPAAVNVDSRAHEHEH